MKHLRGEHLDDDCAPVAGYAALLSLAATPSQSDPAPQTPPKDAGALLGSPVLSCVLAEAAAETEDEDAA